MERVAVLGLAVALATSATAAPNAPSPEAPISASCSVTRLEGGLYGSDTLKAVLPADGKFVFAPGGPGFVDQDGALGTKLAWERRKRGRLFVGGRRLDGPAPPARAYIYDRRESGFQPTYLVFPRPGCWEITGSVADASLTFVVLVEKIGDGPTWRYGGPPRGWRVSTRSRGA